MTPVAWVRTPLFSVHRAPKCNALGIADGNINKAPLIVTLTEGEIHIGWADRTGPAFAIDLNQLVKAAVTEMEILLGQEKAGSK